MVVASGFIEANQAGDAEKVALELKQREIEVSDMKGEKVVFLIERETAAEIKKTLDSLKDIEGVRSVYLAYFSLEGSDEDVKDMLPLNTQ
ncbi:MAG: chaperone NapD [Nitrospirae bacterium]|nr:chaperone NapD [Nitrospirota bacterium]MCL5977197.1 chaperone NapD [Nitrospirota bacterium]